MRILNRIIEFCREKDLLDSGDKVLVGLSGGADSVCLLFMLFSMKEEFDLTISALHVNHGIRGAEADRDEAFCRTLCEKLNIPFYAVRADIPAMAEKEGIGLEEAGRKFRYEAFERKADELGCNRIAVAHHMNDRAETVLFQMIRGSKLNGLAGIREKNGRIVRPLLCVTREEIESSLKEEGLDFVTDSTNADTDYTRNYLRNEILPALESLRPQAARHIAETADYVGRVADYMQAETDALYEACAKEKQGADGPSEIIFDISALEQAHSLIAEAAVYKGICKLAGRKKDITETFVKMVMELVDKQSGRSVDIKYGIVAKKIYETVVLTKASSENAVDTGDGNCNNKLYTELLTVEKGTAAEVIEKRGGLPKDNLKKYFDYDKLLSRHCDGQKAESIELRPATGEDVMTVYRDGRRKKVFDILKDCKVGAERRGKTPVVAMGNEVLLIPGLRTSETCRVDEKTKNILYLYIAEAE